MTDSQLPAPFGPGAASSLADSPIWQPSRRTLLGAAAAMGLMAAPLARAQFRIEVNGVGATQIPIAIAPFRARSLRRLG